MTKTSKKMIVTHGANYHMDDLFAVATMLLANEKTGSKVKYKVTRSIDPKVIEKSDYVLDIGGVYDPKKGRFDHHQEGGSGRFHSVKRVTRALDNSNNAEGIDLLNAENAPSALAEAIFSDGVHEEKAKIPYATFGLIWKQFGMKVAGSKEVFEYVVENLVIPFDAADNGVDTYASIYEDIMPLTVEDYIKLECIEVKNKPEGERDFDKSFMRLIPFAQRVIQLTVEKGKGAAKNRKDALKAYAKAKDKRIVVSEKFLPYDFDDMPKVLVHVYKDLRGGWSAKNMRLRKGSYEGRFYFPEEWRGKRDADLAAVTGVPDARFCHSAGFLAVAGSKQGVLDLCEKAFAEAGL